MVETISYPGHFSHSSAYCSGLFDNFQLAFRKMHSTEGRVIKTAADPGQYPVLILLHLIQPLILWIIEFINWLKTEVGYSGSVLQWFSVNLTDGTFKVALNLFPEACSLSCEVPQGSVLGAVIYLFFKNLSYHFYNDDVQHYCSFNDGEFCVLSVLLEHLITIKTCPNCDHWTR